MHRSMVRCTSCRVSILEAFTSLAGVSIPVKPAPPPRLLRPSNQPTRKFTRFAPLRQSGAQPLSDSSTQSSSDSSSEPPPSSVVPWYLQIEDPTPPAPISPLLALQEIPPLPHDPPPILSPVLTHLSTQIGLDNLTLLDLRHLDPPPALGSNLLMIIGTARSVKHLNVSADRFCRWVRKEYKLRPYADGLLGRNELKLKLRRKARKMKLAQSVGNTVALKDADDGITTGWICVNMGPVDEAVMPETQEDEGDDQMETEVAEEQRASSAPDANTTMTRKMQETLAEDEEEEYHNPAETYIGFGSRSDSPRIVVQMFIEDKRVEMDLEGLWDVRNTRRAQREEKANVEAEAAVGRLQQAQDRRAFGSEAGL
ncbi:uncharacterized protein Z520_01899 [Fonsecaea multimorphosa CBS 102226]|uniref:ATPase synthesis protein 25 n=1 Tax=Fonsecaea multimorphosa CBS 102226 TaxID=1442371 RepID=A0A0D2HIL8_9EURO|nr:uncharacterized protein Z520_01899 [Fonsecaea multimorphosa CBS 102226]KIY01761.1 hypothetical protein Z520_01899 [Fonsecaea multimorphosa CBS 102226]OAL29955.1 hypothetical protein AYO22_01861 [Fonsecaea multimorphosa]